MFSKSKIPRASLVLLGFLLVASFAENHLTEASPLKSLESPNQGIYEKDGDEYLLINPLPLLAQRQGGESTTTKKDDDDGLSVTDYVLIGVGVLVGLIILSCIISYLFCACVKEIICLPITCLTKVLCCCCRD